MKNLVTKLALCTFAALLGLASAPAARADTTRDNSTFTVTEPIEVGGFVLPAGTYFVKVVLLSSNRHTIQVSNVEQTKVFANVLATPHVVREGEVVPVSRYIYYTSASGQPKALRTWFPRETAYGHDIIYPKRRALELAALAKEPVIAIPDEVKEAEYTAVPLSIVTPEREVKPYEAPALAQAPAPAPVAIASNRPVRQLPRTASEVPLLFTLGLLSMAGAFGLRAYSSRTA